MRIDQYKVTVVGAGAVGASIAQRVLEGDIGDVVLLDVLKDVACAKAYDLMDAAAIKDHERSIIGTGDYEKMKGSNIVVITAGLIRKPGMTREGLIAKNAVVVREISEKIKEYAPDAAIIVVTNPLDVMTYLVYKTTGFDKKRIVGMAGILDGSRLINLIASDLDIPRSEVETYVIGSHGDTMVPVLSKTTVNGKPIREVMDKAKLDAIVKRACDRGAEIVKLLGVGSAYYSPSAGVLKIIESIVDDAHDVLEVSAILDGEYGLKDIAIGVPCVIGKNGIENIVELELDEEEKALFSRSAKAVKSAIGLLSGPAGS